MKRVAIFISLAAISLAIGMGLFWYTKHRNILTFRSETILRERASLAQTSNAPQPPQPFVPLTKNTSGAAGLTEPIAEFSERITKKPFGIYITPKTSPVQPDRFTGFHTGVDIEYADVTGDVQVQAIADGAVMFSKWVSGYGGVMVIRHAFNDGELLALYGHLDPASLLSSGAKVTQGQSIGILGDGGTHETDGARKHLHFALHKNTPVDLRGYVQTQEELTGWYDPRAFYQNIE